MDYFISYKFLDFWKTVDKKDGVAVFMSLKELREWSKKVFTQSRTKTLT